MRIGNWDINADDNTISSLSGTQKVEPRAMDVLVYLAGHPNVVVSKDELIDQVWDGDAKSDHTVAVVVSQLRKVFGDDPNQPKYIETIPKRGYRLVASVDVSAGSSVAGSDISRKWLMLTVIACLALLAVFAVVRGSFAKEPVIFVAPVINATGQNELNHVAYALSELLVSHVYQSDQHRVFRLIDQQKAIALNHIYAPVSEDALSLSGSLIQQEAIPVLVLELNHLESGEVRWHGLFPLEHENKDEVLARAYQGMAEALGYSVASHFSVSYKAADDGYWRASYAWSLRDPLSVQNAVSELNELLQTYPDHGAAHALLATIYAHKTGEELAQSRGNTFVMAEHHIDLASQVGFDGPELNIARALLSTYRDKDPQSALDNLQNTAEGSALVWQTRAMVLSASGQHKLALEAIKKALELDPYSPSANWDQVWFLYNARQYKQAITSAETASKVYRPNLLYLALIYMAMDNHEQALHYWITRAEREGLSGQYVQLASGFAAMGDYQEAYGVLESHALNGAEIYSDLPTFLFSLYAGHPDQAQKTLMQIDQGTARWWWIWAKVIPALDDVRKQAVFHDRLVDLAVVTE